MNCSFWDDRLLRAARKQQVRATRKRGYRDLTCANHRSPTKRFSDEQDPDRNLPVSARQRRPGRHLGARLRPGRPGPLVLVIDTDGSVERVMYTGEGRVSTAGLTGNMHSASMIERRRFLVSHDGKVEDLSDTQ